MPSLCLSYMQVKLRLPDRLSQGFHLATVTLQYLRFTSHFLLFIWWHRLMMLWKESTGRGNKNIPKKTHAIKVEIQIEADRLRFQIINFRKAIAETTTKDRRHRSRPRCCSRNHRLGQEQKSQTIWKHDCTSVADRYDHHVSSRSKSGPKKLSFWVESSPSDLPLFQNRWHLSAALEWYPDRDSFFA